MTTFASTRDYTREEVATHRLHLAQRKQEERAQVLSVCDQIQVEAFHHRDCASLLQTLDRLTQKRRKRSDS